MISGHGHGDESVVGDRDFYQRVISDSKDSDSPSKKASMYIIAKAATQSIIGRDIVGLLKA